MTVCMVYEMYDFWKLTWYIALIDELFAGNSLQVDEGLQKAQRLLKQSQKRDYYKILGVSR